MSRPWPLWRLITIAILLVIPSYLALIPTVFAPDRSRGVDTSVVAHLDDSPEPEPEEDDPWTSPSVDAESIERQLKWQMGEDSTRSFDVVAEVRPDRSVLITETITQVFRSARHGIERDIPYEYDELGERLIGFVQVATSPGTPDDLELSDVSGAIRVRIGDPDVTISNAHTYRIQYAIENVVLEKEGRALVPLDMITDWRSEIDNISYRVIGPAEPSDFACYVGTYGSVEGCNEIRLADSGVVAFEEDLPSYSGFSVEVTFPLESFDATPARIERENGLIWAIIAIAMMYVALALAYLRSVRNARRDLERAVRGLDSTFTGKMSHDLPGRRGAGTGTGTDNDHGTDHDHDVIPPPPSGAASEIIPAQYASEQVPVEFVPPVNLDPACLLRVKEGVDADVRRMLAGTLVDLAADGVIGLEQSGDDWIVRRIPQPPRQVKTYEFTLLDAILGADKNEQLLSERVSKLSVKVRDYVKQVDSHLQDLGLLSVSKMPATVQGRSATIARILGQAFIIIGTSIVAFGVTFMLPRHPASVLLLAGFMSAVLYLRDPMMNDGNKNRFTERGCATALRARGFDRFFRESESIHAQAAARSGLMREYMGYAVALGSVETWVSAMPPTQIEAWTGSGFANPYQFRSLYTQRIFARSVASTFSSSTTRSGGFSGGGGGRAGGGFGGGGGGSW